MPHLLLEYRELRIGDLGHSKSDYNFTRRSVLDVTGGWRGTGNVNQV